MFVVPKLIDLEDQNQFRIIPSRYPPINFFEGLVDPAEMSLLWDIESLTNDRLRDDVGDIQLVAAEDRVSGSGSSVVMAAFTHVSRDKPTRFSAGNYGVYYAGLSIETAIKETVYHRERFLMATQEAPCELSMRLYRGKIIKPLHDIRSADDEALHHPTDYATAQRFADELRQLQSWGIIYNSVRHVGGNCIAILRPPAITIPVVLSHLKYVWNGIKITTVLDTSVLMQF